MDNERPNGRAAPVLPADANPCVWMTAGVVAYKICDRNFDCEHCPLDIGLRGAEWPLSSREGCAPPEPTPVDFPDDRLYHPAHTWVQPVDRNRVRCGVDAFAAALLRRAVTLVLPATGATLQQGRIGFWLSGETRPVPLLSPVSGSVVRRNLEAQKRPVVLSESAYDEGWLLELCCDDWPAQRGPLIDADQMRTRARQQRESLSQRVSRFVTHPRTDVGRTMADGGQPLTEFRDLLGPERYRRLILPFLS